LPHPEVEKELSRIEEFGTACFRFRSRLLTAKGAIGQAARRARAWRNWACARLAALGSVGVAIGWATGAGGRR
jgi:hypothetical protein